MPSVTGIFRSLSLQRAVIDADTRWPNDFDPVAAGVIGIVEGESR